MEMQVVKETIYLGPAFRGFNSGHEPFNPDLGGWLGEGGGNFTLQLVFP